MAIPLTALMFDAYGGSGGIAEFNRHLLESLADDDRLDLSALGMFGDASVGAPNGVDWAIPKSGDRWRFIAAAARHTWRRKPSLMLCGHAHLGPIAHTLAAASRAKVWTTTHGIEVWRDTPDLKAGERSYPRRESADRLLSRSTLITTVSRYSRARLLAWCPIRPDRVHVIPNTIDLAKFTPGPRPADLAAKLGVGDSKVLLTVSRLDPNDSYKGQDRVIPLLPELERRAGPIRYVIVGTGSDRTRLEDLARRSNAAHLTVFAGFVPTDELTSYYRLADAFVMPSTGEGFGIVFLEAMACGCPTIAGDLDGSSEALADGELGRLVDPFDGARLVEAMAGTLRAGRSRTESIRGVERFGLDRFRAQVKDSVSAFLQLPA